MISPAIPFNSSNMVKQNAPDERVVYLTLKNVFKGHNAEVRQPKKIKKLISENTEQVGVSSLVESHNIDNVCNTARVLLTEEVFGSTLKAKLRFPEIFDVSPAQSAERAASVAEAVRTDSKALHDATNTESRLRELSLPRSPPSEIIADTKPVRRPRPVMSTWSLFPAYLPLGPQYRLLTKLQNILEVACFHFAQANMPEILKHHDWGCSEAGELHIWMSEFITRPQDFSAVDQLGKPLQDLLRSISDIRHAAVHRLNISARGLEQFLLDAEAFLVLIQDDERIRWISDLRRETVFIIEELERNKHILSSNYDDTKREISAKRAELDLLEKAAAQQLENDDAEYRLISGTSLDLITSEFIKKQEYVDKGKGRMENTDEATSSSNMEDMLCSSTQAKSYSGSILFHSDSILSAEDD